MGVKVSGKPVKEDEVVSNVCGTEDVKAPTRRQHCRFN